MAGLAAIFPVTTLAELSNSGTLFVFTAVALAALRLRFTEPQRPRSFRVSFIAALAPISALSCRFLHSSFRADAAAVRGVDLLIFGAYGWRRSLLVRL